MMDTLGPATLSFIERLSSFRDGKYNGIVGRDSKFFPL